MSRIWFTSDLHIGHLRIATLRNFSGTNVHDATLAHNWDTTVAPEDSVWVLGDISAGGGEAQTRALEWLSNRPGTKHLVPGNHDGIHPMNRDSHRHFGIYTAVFSSVQVAGYRKVVVGNETRRVVLSHFPYHSNHEFEQRFNQWRLRDEGRPLLHGHTHSAQKLTVSPNGTPQVHIGVDAWNLSPVSPEQVSGFLSEFPSGAIPVFGGTQRRS